MTSSAKRAGARYETDVLAHLRGAGHSAERLAKAGSLDEGDVVIHSDEETIIAELKVRRDKTTGLSLGTFCDEARVEAQHYADARGLPVLPVPVVFIKCVGKSIEDSFVVMRLRDFLA